MALGQPSISDVNKLDQRVIAQAVSNIRQRIEQLEKLATVATNVANSASNTNNTQLNVIRQQIAVLQAAVASLGGLVGQPPGIQVWTGSVSVTRSVVPGSANVTIENGDGVDGDIVVTVAASEGGDIVLYDNRGQAAITSSGGALIKA